MLIVFPTSWDVRQIAALGPRVSDRYDLVYAEPDDAACPWDFDILDFVERAVQGRLRGGAPRGVLSSSDYPGATAAAAIATALGLPGSRPEAVLCASHKYQSRLAQRDAAPEATPPFRLLPVGEPLPRDLLFPCFVKPVKGAFSMLSGRFDERASLEAFLAGEPVREFVDHYMTMFDTLVRTYTDFPVGGRAFVAEGVLRGQQVTVEGYVSDGRTRILGVVDSTLHPDRPSFVRFDLPSSAPPDVQSRMESIVARAVSRLGLDDTLFNAELMWNPGDGAVNIVEFNPRMAGQFADLYQKVLGINSYEIALALAAGREPPEVPSTEHSTRARPTGRAGFACAASVPLRVFEPCTVVNAPDPTRIAEIEHGFPGVLIWPECETDELLGEFGEEDGHSRRYAVVNLGAPSRADLDAKLEQVVDALGYRFRPLT